MLEHEYCIHCRTGLLLWNGVPVSCIVVQLCGQKHTSYKPFMLVGSKVLQNVLVLNFIVDGCATALMALVQCKEQQVSIVLACISGRSQEHCICSCSPPSSLLHTDLYFVSSHSHFCWASSTDPVHGHSSEKGGTRHSM